VSPLQVTPEGCRGNWDDIREQARELEVRADQVAAVHEQALAPVRDWLGELPPRSVSWSEETQQVVAVLADELRARIGG
jgi:hypothetical protein